MFAATPVPDFTATFPKGSMRSRLHPLPLALLACLAAGLGCGGGYAPPAATGAVGAGGTAATHLFLRSSENPSVSGLPVAFTATVTAAAPGTPSGGTVTFLDNGAALGAPVALSAGAASLASPDLGAGQHAITASYSGAGGFGPSSGSLTETVGQLAASVILNSSQPQATFGQALTLTATIRPAPAGSTDTVTFLDDGITLGAAAVIGGTANLSLPGLAVGAHAISAVYSGDPAETGATSAALQQLVGLAPTGLTLTAAPNPCAANSTVTFSAVVSPAAATGTVQFLNDGVIMGQGEVVNGMASFQASGFAVGSHTMTAQYAGDPSYAPSTAPALTQIVGVATYTVSGGIALDDPYLSGVPDGTLVTLNSTPPQTATTRGGSFRFANVPAGSYTLTPSGAANGPDALLFTPDSQFAIVINTSVDLGQAFVATRQYTVSGTVTGVQPGIVYLGLTPAAFPSGTALFIASPAPSGQAFSIAGLPAGTYALQARQPIQATGGANSSDAVYATTVTVPGPSGDVSGLQVPLAVAPTPLTQSLANGQRFTASPMDAAAFLQYQPILDGTGAQIPTGYRVRSSTDPAFPATSTTAVDFPSSSTQFGSSNNFVVSGLANGTPYYFQLQGLSDAAVVTYADGTGTATSFGPVTPVPTATSSAASTNTVTIDAALPVTPLASSTLYVGILQDPATAASGATTTVVADQPFPAGGSTYAINESSLIPGTVPYTLFGWLDLEGKGFISPGDPVYAHPPLDIATLPFLFSLNWLPDDLSRSFLVQASPATLALTLKHGLKNIAGVRLLSGPRVYAPMDLVNPAFGSREFDVTLPLAEANGGTRLGDSYTFLVVYSDGSSEPWTLPVI